jgi:hypothetical protein
MTKNKYFIVSILLSICLLFGYCGKKTAEKSSPAAEGELAPSADLAPSKKTPAAKTKAAPANFLKSVVLKPELVTIKEPLQAVITTHEQIPEDFKVIYKFWKNMQLLSEQPEAVLQPGDYQKNDTLFVDVEIHDQDGFLEKMRSQPLLVSNSAPEITAIPFPEKIDFGTHLIQVQAEDPDNDSLTYSLEGSNIPAAVSIDSKNGEISYKLDAIPSEDWNFTVRVQDPDGAYATRDVHLAFSDKEALQ